MEPKSLKFTGVSVKCQSCGMEHQSTSDSVEFCCSVCGSNVVNAVYAFDYREKSLTEFKNRFTDYSAYAFGQGCDARIAGESITTCPYPDYEPLAKAWRNGWNDVHNHWGRGAPRGRGFRPLPSIQN